MLNADSERLAAIKVEEFLEKVDKLKRLEDLDKSPMVGAELLSRSLAAFSGLLNAPMRDLEVSGFVSNGQAFMTIYLTSWPSSRRSVGYIRVHPRGVELVVEG